MKLTYWVAQCLTDAPCYSIRERTKRECVEQLSFRGHGPDGEPMLGRQFSNRYSPPHKVTLTYEDGFDLMYQCLSAEGGPFEG